MVIDLFHYLEEDIFVMTDEEKNVGTEHWPSMENIVSFFLILAGFSRLHIQASLTLENLTNSVASHGQPC